MCVLQIKHLMIMKWTIKLKRVYEPAEAEESMNPPRLTMACAYS